MSKYRCTVCSHCVTKLTPVCPNCDKLNPFVEINDDPVHHPKHYTSHPSGVECIQITEHMSFNIGNAIKYLWRADEKGAPIQDLEKAVWYIKREIERRKKRE